MIEAYKVGISLVLDQAKILGPLGEIFSAMERIEGIQKNVQGGINQMAAGYRGAARAANALADAVDRVNRAQSAVPRTAAPPMPPSGMMVPGGPGAPGAPAPRLVPPSAPLLLTYSNRPAGAPAPSGGGAGGGVPLPQYSPLWRRGARPGTADLMMLGMGAGVAADGAFSLVDQLFSAGMDVDKIKAGLLTQQFTPDQVAQAMAAAKATQRNVPGSAIGGNLEIVSMLQAMTQNAGDAIELMPEYAKVAVAMSASGTGDQLAELQAAMRGGELRGILYGKDKSGKEVLNKPAVANFLHSMMAINAMTHGTIGPAQVTQFLQSSGVAGMMLSDDDLAASIPLMQAMKPANAGTALSGFSQQFSAGKMSEAALNMLTDMRIVKDPSKARKMGMGQFMLLPGAMDVNDVNDARFHPAHFIMDTLLPRIREYEAKNYGKAFTGADDKTQVAMIAAAFQQIASRIPGGKEMAEVFRNNPLIERDVLAYHKEMGVDIFGTQVANNPKVQLDAFHSALNGLMISLAEPNMKTGVSVLSDLATGMNRVSKFIDKNPDIARKMVDWGVAFGLMNAAIAAAIPTIILMGAATKAWKWAVPEAVPVAEGGAGLVGALGSTGASVASKLGRLAGLISLPLLLKEAYDIPHDLLFGSEHTKAVAAEANRRSGGATGWDKGEGLLGDIKALIAAFHADNKRSLQANITVNVPGQKPQTTRSTVQMGTTGFDGSMSHYPSGPAAGDGK